MEFLNNTRHISGLLLLLALSLFSCKKKDLYTSFYFESVAPSSEGIDEAQVQPSPTVLEVYRFSNPSPFDKLSVDGNPYELVWLRAQKTTDFVPLNSAPGVDDNSRTQMRLLYDNTALYITLYCWDKSVTFNSLAPNQDLRGNSDLISIYIEPDGNNQNIYSIQVAPNGTNIDCSYSIATGTGITIPSGYASGHTATTYRNWDPHNGSIIGWYTEIKIPFNDVDANFNLSTPSTTGNTTWRMNVIRENFDSTGNVVASRGRYGWKNPAGLGDNNSTAFYNIHFNTNFIDNAPFPVDVKGEVISAGPVNLSDCGFNCVINRNPFGASNTSSFDISLGKRVNPGLVLATQGVNAGDSIRYRMYVINQDGSKSYSTTVQKMKVR